MTWYVEVESEDGTWEPVGKHRCPGGLWRSPGLGSRTWVEWYTANDEVRDYFGGRRLRIRPWKGAAA